MNAGLPITAWETASGEPHDRGPWEPVATPHSWDARTGARRVYRTLLGSRLTGSPEARHRLRFGACATTARIVLDGRAIGSHIGDWVPFDVEIPPGHESRGEIVVAVDAGPDHATRGFLPTCGLVHAGLWQDVRLLTTGPVVLLRDAVHHRFDGESLELSVPTEGPLGKLRGRLLGPGGDELASAETTGDRLVFPEVALATWDPRHPRLHTVAIEAREPDGEISDRMEYRFGHRRVATDGDRLLLNGLPLQLRGILHWGYYPEIGAPNPPRKALERELRGYLARGFNAVKCCLFIPPRHFLELCDVLGLLVWQEYPLWLRPLRGDDLIAEYARFFLKDRGHPSVILRSLTCENDAIDPEALDRVLGNAREVLPGELILDNSAWLQLSQKGDFYDEHPYLHNGQWEPYLERTLRSLAARPRRPLLFGETMCADALPIGEDLARETGFDVLRYRAAWHAGEWSQRIAQSPDFDSGARHPAIQVRRHQIERLRQRIPGAGYVINAARDIPAAPVGLASTRGTDKFRAEDFAWQRDTMPLVDLPRRSFVAGEAISIPAWLSHFGADTLTAAPVRWRASWEAGSLAPVTAAPGATLPLGTIDFVAPLVSDATPLDLALRVGEISARWRLWIVPEAETPDEVLTFRSLHEAWPHLEAGRSVVLLAAAPHVGGWRVPEHVFWSPIPALAPEFLDGTDRELLHDLLFFDLLSGRALFPPRRGQAVPLVDVVDLHGQPEDANSWPLAFATSAGTGKLLVTALEHEDTPAGRWLLGRFAAWLAAAPAPRVALRKPPEIPTIILDGPWTMERPGTEIFAGTPRRTAGRNVFEGWARFETTITVPESWGSDVHLRAEAVGDAYEIFVDDHPVAFAGDREGVLRGMRDLPRTFLLGDHLEPGKTHRLRLDIRDWRGAGGLIGPLYLTTNPENRLVY